ncbi:MAG: hypothetical protein WCK98_07950 [bacterium]
MSDKTYQFEALDIKTECDNAYSDLISDETRNKIISDYGEQGPAISAFDVRIDLIKRRYSNIVDLSGLEVNSENQGEFLETLNLCRKTLSELSESSKDINSYLPDSIKDKFSVVIGLYLGFVSVEMGRIKREFSVSNEPRNEFKPSNY